jgi:hypothetical protein
MVARREFRNKQMMWNGRSGAYDLPFVRIHHHGKWSRLQYFRKNIVMQIHHVYPLDFTISIHPHGRCLHLRWHNRVLENGFKTLFNRWRDRRCTLFVVRGNIVER